MVGAKIIRLDALILLLNAAAAAAAVLFISTIVAVFCLFLLRVAAPVTPLQPRDATCGKLQDWGMAGGGGRGGV